MPRTLLVPDARQGEIWTVDLGMAAKVRPCLLLTDFPADDELALITVLPHTTSLRANLWELAIPKPFLKPGAFHLQQIQSVSVARLVRKLGAVTDNEWRQVQDKLRARLSL
jgi:mRNA interferase MazF